MKQKVFEVCAGLITIPQFEEWFYNDVEIQCSILEDDNVLRLCSIDLRKKGAQYELNTFCFETFDKEEFYVFVIEMNAKNIVETEKEVEIIDSVRNICNYSGWGDSKHLFYSLFLLEDQYEDFCYSMYSTRKQILDEIKINAEMIVERFEKSSFQQRKNWVFDGLDRDLLIIHSSGNETKGVREIVRKKRWYQFWK